MSMLTSPKCVFCPGVGWGYSPIKITGVIIISFWGVKICELVPLRVLKPKMTLVPSKGH